MYAYGAIAALVFANTLVWPEIAGKDRLSVTFFDVGQGDAIFIETPQGHQMLIDGGPQGARLGEKLGSVLSFWDRSIDVVLLTHPDADHLTGLVTALERYDVENIIWTGVEKDTQVFASWEEAMTKEKARIVVAEAPQRVLLGNAVLHILFTDTEATATNDTSIVSKLSYGERTFLLPGDISKSIESKMIEQGIDIEADILKVPHHGSKTSSTEAFLAAISPELAIIQVGGDNRYGHPNEEVLRRFSALQIPILRTDEIGDIVIEL
jgi:competence protein ComEC